MRIGARTLVEWVCRTGDIHVRYDETTEAEEGIATQRRIQRRRGTGYLREQRVTARWQRGRSEPLEISGRIDGLERRSGEVLVEEIKTTREDPERLYRHAGALHFAQLRLYGAMLARAEAEPPPLWCLRLVYCHPDTETETAFEERSDPAALVRFFDDVCRAFAVELARLRRHRRRRDRRLRMLDFPFGEWRTAQRRLAHGAYRAIRDGGALLAEAPTGTGKTLGTLFPALRAVGDGYVDRVIYLSARGTGQLAATAAVTAIASGMGHLRTVTLTAKNRVCFKGEPECDPDRCEFARGYYDRRRAAVDALCAVQTADREAIEAVARTHEVCPFELSLDASIWADVVICDYNYVFDPVVRLKRVKGAAHDRTALLVDEAHQLAPRVQDALSTRLERRVLADAAKNAAPAVARTLRTLERRISSVFREHVTVACVESAALASPPAALQRAIERALDALADAGEDASTPALRDIRFALARWMRASAWYEPGRFATLLKGPRRDAVVELRCLDPSAHVARVFEEFDSHVRFSGTLHPASLFERLHGCEAEALRLPSPFPPERLGVFVVPDVSVRYRDRAASLDRLVDAIAALVSARPGNYLVALPSFEYLAAAFARFVARYPDVAVVRQNAAMDPDARVAFLARFEVGSAPVLGFVVLGGVFAESVDLPGDRLVGILVAGIGLPPPTLERETERAAFGEMGRLVAYLHPAVSRVVQAAGRIIRGPEDRGVVCLVDDRFTGRDLRPLLPQHWRPEIVRADGLRTRLDRFWQNR